MTFILGAEIPVTTLNILKAVTLDLRTRVYLGCAHALGAAEKRMTLDTSLAYSGGIPASKK
jgi:hypothetical protein